MYLTKTLIFLHGARGSSSKYIEELKSGRFPQPADTKIIFLGSLSLDGSESAWFKVNKKVENDDPLRHNIDDINKQSKAIA